MIGRWHVWILGIACHSKCPNGLKFDQSCTHSHNTCLICLDSILMCQKLDHKIHNIWLFFLTFKNLLKRIDSTVDSIVLSVLPGPVASRRYTLRPSAVLLAGECPSLQLQRLSGLVQGSKGPRVQGEFYGFYDVLRLRSTCTCWGLVVSWGSKIIQIISGYQQFGISQFRECNCPITVQSSSTTSNDQNIECFHRVHFLTSIMSLRLVSDSASASSESKSCSSKRSAAASPKVPSSVETWRIAAYHRTRQIAAACGHANTSVTRGFQ